MLDVPTPNKLLTALNARSTGAARVTPAFCTGSFNIPTKKVSARLYKTITSELKTVGTANFATALGIGVFSNNWIFSLFSMLFTSSDIITRNPVYDKL